MFICLCYTFKAKKPTRLCQVDQLPMITLVLVKPYIKIGLSHTYCKVPKFSDTKKLCCNLPKIQTKSLNLRVYSQEYANGIANSEDPDQTAPRGAV